MNKKVMAVAVAGVLAAPASVALAQTSTVQIGGSITAFYYQHKVNNSTAGQKTDIMETSEPEIYVRGEEKLGGGLSAWFQCTSSFPVIDGSAVANTSGWCGRNSGIGFKGAWGNVFFGNWDLPQKLTVDNPARGWWGGTNSFTGGAMILLAGGTASGATNPSGLAGSGSSAFFRRQANSVNYHSPSWNGFSFQAAFSAGNEQTAVPETNPLSPRLYSLAASYSSGPLYIGAGYERHNDYNPASRAIGTTATTYAGGNDTRWTIVGGYTFAGVLNLRGVYAKMDYDVTNSTSLDADGWGVFADWNIQGPHTLRGQYVRVSDTGGNAVNSVGSYAAPLTGAGVPVGSTGAKQWGLAYSYAFSKRTMGSIAYTKMDNDANAAFSKGKQAVTLGGSQHSYGIILQHRF